MVEPDGPIAMKKRKRLLASLLLPSMPFTLFGAAESAQPVMDMLQREATLENLQEESARTQRHVQNAAYDNLQSSATWTELIFRKHFRSLSGDTLPAPAANQGIIQQAGRWTRLVFADRLIAIGEGPTDEERKALRDSLFGSSNESTPTSDDTPPDAPNAPQEVKFSVNQKALGATTVTKKGADFILDKEFVVTALYPYLSDAAKIKLGEAVAGDIPLTLSALQAVGVQGGYQEVSQTLSLKVPDGILAITMREKNAYAREKKNAEIFAKVFKQKAAPQAEEGIATLWYRGEPYDHIQFYKDPETESLYYEAAPIYFVLEGLVVEDVIAALRHAQTLRQLSKEDSSSVVATLSNAALEDLGITLYRIAAQKRMDLYILDQKILLERSYSFRSQPFKPPVEPRGRDPFTGYANLYTRSGYIHHGADKGWQAFGANLKGVVNWRGWVVEAEGFYQDRDQKPFRRGDVTLVRQVPEKLLTAKAGDVAFPIRSLQSSERYAGFTLTKALTFDNYTNLSPTSEQKLRLNKDANVDVKVNGQLVRTIFLPAGDHVLRDLPLNEGNNDVILRVREILGREYDVPLSMIYMASNLKEGLSEWAVGLGAPWHNKGSERDYDFEKPALSAFYRSGLTSWLTAGVNAQGSEEQLMFGAEALMNTRLGALNVDAGLSFLSAKERGFAIEGVFVPHTPNTGDLKRVIRVTTSMRYQDRNFAALGSLTPNNRRALETRASASRAFGDISASLAGNYIVNRDNPNTMGANLRLSKRLLQSLSSSASFSFQRDTAKQNIYDGSIELRYTFGAEQQQGLDYAHYFRDNVDSLRYSYRTRERVRGYTASAQAIRDNKNDTTDLTGDLRHEGRWYELQARTAASIDAGCLAAARTDLVANTGLCFVCDQVALTRPINDSFAMIRPLPEMEEQLIGVNKSDFGHWEHFTTTKRPFVLNDVTSYNWRRIKVEFPEMNLLEIGDPGLYYIEPTYKSGVLLTVGSPPSVTISGSVSDSNGPVGTKAFDIISLSNPEFKPVKGFTRSNGEFSVPRLPTGQYALKMRKQQIPFEIPATARGKFVIGLLKLQ